MAQSVNGRQQREPLDRMNEDGRTAARTGEGDYLTARRLTEEAITEATGYRFPRPGRYLAVIAGLVAFVALLAAGCPR